MRIRMGSSILAAGLLVVLSVAFVSAGTTTRLNVTIPFAFKAGEVVLPSGDYLISEPSMQGYMLIQNKRDAHATFVASFAGKSNVQPGNAVIIFHRYDDQYFLSRVINGLGDTPRQLPVSKLEKEFLGGKAHTTAQNVRQPEVISIAAR